MNPDNVRCPCSNARYVEVKLGQASLSPMTAAISSGDSGGQDHRNPMELSLFFPYALFLLVVLYFLSPLVVLREIPLSQLIPRPQGPFPKYIPLTLVHPAVYIKHLPSHLYTGVQVPRRVQLPFHRCLAGCSARTLPSLMCTPPRIGAGEADPEARRVEIRKGRRTGGQRTPQRRRNTPSWSYHSGQWRSDQPLRGSTRESSS